MHAVTHMLRTKRHETDTKTQDAVYGLYSKLVPHDALAPAMLVWSHINITAVQAIASQAIQTFSNLSQTHSW